MPKNDPIGLEIGIFFHFGPGLAGPVGALLAGGFGAQAVSRKTPIYFIYIVKVYEEEVLGSTVPLWWSSNGTKIAFASFDDTAVKPITLTRYIELQV